MEKFTWYFTHQEKSYAVSVESDIVLDEAMDIGTYLEKMARKTELIAKKINLGGKEYEGDTIPKGAKFIFATKGDRIKVNPMPRGGKRTGAGRKKGDGKYGESSRVIRIPESLSNEDVEIALSIKELREILGIWEEKSKESTSPRYWMVKKLIEEIRSLGY